MYRRNRKQLIQAGSLPNEDTIPLETMHVPQTESQPVNTECSSQTDSMETTESPTTTAPTTVVPDNVPALRRSGRITRPPAWMADYVPSEIVI